MKRLLLFTILCSLFSVALAQPPQGGGRGGRFQQGPTITGRITGVLIDSVSRTPVEFATVVLIDPQTGKQIDGTVTDEKGEFKITDIKNSAYQLKLDFLGFQPRTIDNVELTLEKPDVDLGTLYLLPESLLLEAVEVTAERGVFENKIDKIVYNAEKDVGTAGGDASDVLQRVPLLAVDVEGNVSLRGSSNVLILINGKPSTIFAGNVGDALKTFPADQIKSVEVITTPTAKYDGEGSAGIINIITKKKSIEGFTGSVNASVGTRSNRGSLNLNLAKGRFGLNLNGSGWLNWNRPSFNNFYRESYATPDQADSPVILDQDGTGDSQFYGPRASIGAFYDLNAYNSFSSSFNFRGFGRRGDNETDALFTDPNRNIFQEYSRINESRSLRSGFDWTTDYRRTFKKPQQEFVVAVQISGDQSFQRNTIEQVSEDPTLVLDEKNRNDGLNLEYTFQTDYTHPFSKKIKMETGAKAVIRRIDSDFRFESFEAEANDYVIDPNRSDIFYYDQDVYAGYLSFNVELGDKYGFVVGSRYEHTTIAGNFDQDPTTFTNNYDNILPSIIFSRKLNQFSTLKLSYTKRIQRPSLRFVNPYVDLTDPRDISFGNPYLDPENTDQYELSYNAFIKGVVLNGAVYYRQTNDEISSVAQVDEEGVTETTFLNIGQQNSLGFNVFTSMTIKKFWTLRGGFNLFSYNAQGIIDGETVSRDAWMWRANLNSTFSFKNDFKLEMFGFFNSPRQTIQGSRGAYSQFSISARKEFNKRMSLGLSIIQPFTENLSFPSKLSGSTFRQESEFGVAVRSFNAIFSYNFGKLDFKNQRRRRGSAIDNDDLKSGDDNNF